MHRRAASVAVMIFSASICHCFNISVTENCNGHIETVIGAYFSGIDCITITRLTSEHSDILFSYVIPRFVRRVHVHELNYLNLTVRPRRDHYDPKHGMHFCPENGQGSLILVETTDDLYKYIYSGQITAFWSPQSLIFVYVTQGTCDGDILHKLWSTFKTPHVVISGCKCNILFYDPFYKFNDNWGKLLTYKPEEILTAPDKIRNSMMDMNGYIFTAILFRSPFSVPQSPTEFIGIDVNLLVLMSSRMNFTLKIIFPHDNDQYGFKLPNGTYTGALRRLLDGDADIINVHYFIKDYLTVDIEFGASTMADNLCVIMRKAEKIPDWQLLYYCFDELVWIAIILMYFVTAITWIVVEKLLTYVMDGEMYPFLFLDTFRMMITSSIFRIPVINSERVFLAFGLLAFMTLVGAFQGSLYGVYSTPMFYKDINTLQELSHTQTKIKSEYMFFIDDVFSDVSYPVIYRLKNMISFYNDSVKITHRVATQMNFATLVRQSEVEIDNSTTTYYDANGYNLIHMVKECPRSYSLAYIFPVNSPFAPRLNMIMLRGAQAGLYVKWYKEMAFNVSDSSARKNGPSINDAFKVFSLKDMQIAFYQLIIGMCASILVFIGELVHSSKCR